MNNKKMYRVTMHDTATEANQCCDLMVKGDWQLRGWFSANNGRLVLIWEKDDDGSSIE